MSAAKRDALLGPVLPTDGRLTVLDVCRDSVYRSGFAPRARDSMGLTVPVTQGASERCTRENSNIRPAD
jgi:hypothetical protein